MNFQIITAIAEAGAAVAVTITLIYLALQVRYLKHQNMLASFQHIYNAVNDFDNSISQSEELASIVVRGHVSRTGLTLNERLRFDHVFGRLLNIVESRQFQVLETTGAGAFREEQLRNIREFVRARCDSPGVYDFWEQFKQCYNAAMHQLRIDAYKKAWDLFFSWAHDPVVFDMREMDITAGDDVAFVATVMRCAGTEANGEDIELDFRLTMGLRKIDNEWIVTNEHHSIPAIQ